ncbi:gamma-glutamyltransferase [Endozoicomonas sp. 8E]|uniref:gamma-glutamyltransferase n=1 Tax=Endozoicomonas sp. 8E TaxID=3035692 RepID=UPI002939410E|nr:gamma-glutamyltransferase [Endozoicomonas sp. 8E]WOG28302.1 gamma-glutamyltransferase [Endozoicomonas sp. 8E]
MSGGMSRRCVITASLLAACIKVQAEVVNLSDDLAPEAATGFEQKSLVKASKHMVVAANPLAVQAGDEVLRRGGSAADAAIAVQLVLNLVEPQSSGIGGGAFSLYFDAKKNRLITLDGRETAPVEATPTLFLDSNGKPLQFYDAVVGGRSVGTPGTVKLLEEMHQRYGKRPWSELFQPAIKLAEEGFIVSPRLASLITMDQKRLSRYSGTREYFFDEKGQPLQAGAVLKNPEFARTLRLIARDGPKAFYEGKLAERIVKTVKEAEGNPGVLSKKDLRNYQVKERTPVCSAYRQYSVCGMGPPSSGATTVGQILGILQSYDLASLGADNPESWRLFAGASRLAFADRARYLADSDYVPVPVQGLLDSQYLANRARQLQSDQALKTVKAGKPVWQHASLQADDQSIELPSTSHISIVDAEGNALSMTTTIENGFGSRLMVGGFLLNNEMTDFSFSSHDNGTPIANRVEPGKRPRSSMAPTMVMDKKGQPYMVLGSPGGSRIISYVAKTLVAHIDWGMDIQEAIALPHKLNPFGVYELEQNTEAERLKSALEKLGYSVKVRDLNSGLHGIVITDKGLEGGADPRREGVAMGI